MGLMERERPRQGPSSDNEAIGALAGEMDRPAVGRFGGAWSCLLMQTCQITALCERQRADGSAARRETVRPMGTRIVRLRCVFSSDRALQITEGNTHEKS